MNLTKKTLRYEIWAMLTDEAKKAMGAIKKQYLDSIMADVESYANGKMVAFLKEEYEWNGIVSIEQASTKKHQLKVKFKDGKSMTFKNYISILEFIREENASFFNDSDKWI